MVVSVTRYGIPDPRAPRSSGLQWLPRPVGIKLRHGLGRHSGVGPQVFLIDDPLVVHEKGHDAGCPVLRWVRHQRKATDQLVAYTIVRGPTWRARALPSKYFVINPTAPLRSCRQFLSALRSSGASHTRKEPEGCYQFAALQMMCTPFHRLK